MSNQDSSPKVPQRDKLKEKLTIKEFPWTERQKQFIDIALDKDTKIMFVNGAAGTSKTLLSVYCALKLISDKRVSDLLYVRSAVESADRGLGALPGLVSDKMAFYNLPLYDKLSELLPKSQIEFLLKSERVSMFPINFCRGLNWNAKCIVLDEAQNSSLKEIITLLTRLGKFTRCFVLADPEQTDLHNGHRGGFEKMIQVFDNDESRVQGIHIFTFTEEDIVRSELVKFLVKKFKELK